VYVPEPLVSDVNVTFVVRSVPVNTGKVSVVVPATAGADRVTVPDVSPDTTIDDIFIPYKTTQR
jgi:hypothetical protein